MEKEYEKYKKQIYMENSRKNLKHLEKTETLNKLGKKNIKNTHGKIQKEINTSDILERFHTTRCDYAPLDLPAPRC